MTKQSDKTSTYENNPFFIAGNGITALFGLARGVGILLIVLSLVGLFSNNFSRDSPEKPEDTVNNFFTLIGGWSASEWSLAISSVLLIGLALAMISALFNGVSSYTSAQLARGKSVQLGAAFHIAFENLWNYLWLQVIIFVKLVLWTLLFIIPGIIMSFRYSLSGVAFYDDNKNLRGNAAIKESLRLTKGAWLTTFSANTLFNLLTFSAISSVVTTAVNAILYKQFDKLDDKKPAAHWLSWLTLILPIAVVTTVLFLVVGIGIIVGILGL